MQYNDFTEMPVWQESSELVSDLYSLTALLPRSEEYALISQVKRAALSIPANIAEGFGRNYPKEKIHFYSYARASASEVRSHLLIAVKLNFLKMDQTADCQDKLQAVVHSLNKLIKSQRNY